MLKMLTIDNPVLEKKIMNIAQENWETAENYIINMIYFYEENKKSILLNDISDTKINWKSFNNVDDLMKDLLN